jgi:hypothetical protein
MLVSGLADDFKVRLGIQLTAQAGSQHAPVIRHQ